MKTAIAGSIVALVALGAAPNARSAGLPPPPPEIGRLTLPSGRLQLLNATEKAAGFVVLDSVAHPKAGEATVVLYRVYDPGLPAMGKVAVQIVSRERFDCAGGVHQALGAQAFDARGNLVIWTPADQPKPVPAGTGYDYLAKFACDGQALPEPVVFTGYAEALAAAHQMIEAERSGSKP